MVNTKDNISEIESEDSIKDNILSELNEPIWAVVSFEKVLEDGLTYDEAVKQMQESHEQKKSGLCIITNQAAERIAK